MTKLSLIVSVSSLEVHSCDAQTSALLGAQKGSHLQSLLADKNEFEELRVLLDRVLRRDVKFATLNLVFSAPMAPSVSPDVDRSPVQGIFRSPIRAFHSCGELHVCCFAHIELLRDDEDYFVLEALEYSRQHREDLLRQEFGSWMLEDKIESSVIATDPMGKIVFWNRFAKELYQWNKEEVLGRSIIEITPSEMTQEQATEIFSRLSRGEHWKGFFGVKRKDSSVFMAHVIDTPVVDNEGNLRFIVGISDDYTQVHDLMNELKALNSNLEEEAIMRTEQLLEKEKTLRMVGAAVKESDTGVLITEDDFRIVWSNHAVSKLLHLPEITVMNRCPWDLPLKIEAENDNNRKHDEANAGHTDLRTCFLAKTNFNVAVQLTNNESEAGKVLAVHVQAMPGSKQNMVILRDLTFEIKAEKAQREAEKAAATSKIKTEMLQMLSHEFRTPLHGIMGAASTMIRDLEPDVDRSTVDCMSTILASSRLLLTLINNILDLGKMESVTQAVEKTKVSVLSSIRESISYCEFFASVNEVQIVLDKEVPDDLSVICNPLRLQQILVNLLSNAIKYGGGPGSTVNIDFRQCTLVEATAAALSAGTSDLKFCNCGSIDVVENGGESVVIMSIRDHGQGISDEEMGNLFGKYAQLEKQKHSTTSKFSRTQPMSTGLGLHLVLNFVRSMDGHIFVKNSESGGSIFSFWFPQAQLENHVNSSTKSDASLSQEISTHLKLSKEAAALHRIIVVDDSVINLKVMARMLSRLGVTFVKTFLNGSSAMEYIKEVEDCEMLPNLILTDLEMPILNGFELIKLIGDCSKYKEPPTFVACTADWTAETEHCCLRSGFNAVLRKPITLDDLGDFLASIEVF